MGAVRSVALLAGDILHHFFPDLDEREPLRIVSERRNFDCKVEAVWENVEVESNLPSEERISQMEPPMPSPIAHWLWLSPTEQKIVDVASNAEWKTKVQLAEEAGVPCDRDHEAILRNMVERKILESGNGKGYRLFNPPKPTS